MIANVKNNNPARIDMTRRYALSAGARVIPRSATSVQIGTDAPRCVVVMDAPTDSLPILNGLDGASAVGQVLSAYDADPLVWSDLLGQLAAAELLVPVAPPDRGNSPAVSGAHLTDERSDLTHRHGQGTAARILQARDDALIVVRGGSRIASSIVSLLAAAGIGHIHHDVDRPARPGSAQPAGTPRRSSTTRQRAAGVVNLREMHPTVRVHVPAAHQHPTMVVLAGDAMPDLSLAASYIRDRVPHLAVTAGVARAVVGPLVLPGRSSCLSCAHRQRTDADPEWPVVARQLADGHVGGSALLTAAGAYLATGEVLAHVDGLATPRTIDGTLDWRAGEIAPRRRTWSAHPDCGCRASGRPGG